MLTSLPIRVILTFGMTVGLAAELPRVRAAENEDEALAYQARAILSKHCQSCHGSEQPRAGLNILNYDLLVTGRGLVLPNARPEFSELLQRVEEGSMPPGSREKLSVHELQVIRKWVTAQAPYIAPEPGVEFVLQTIAADWKTLKKDRGEARYFSLNDLITEPEPWKALQEYREALAYVFGKYSGKPLTGSQFKAVDRARTIFRISLLDLDWDLPIYDARLKGSEKPDRAKLNFMDAILLSYPYGVIPEHSEAFSQLEAGFLRTANQIRPIAYVRGDWLVGAMLQEPINRDLRVLPSYPDKQDSMKKARDRFNAPIALQTAVAELGTRVSSTFLREKIVDDFPLLLPFKNDKGTVTRAHWEKAFLHVQQRLGGAQPIWNIDTLPRVDVSRGTSVKNIDIFTYNVTTKAHTDTFKPGQKMYVGVKNLTKRAFYVELIWLSTDKTAFVVDRQPGGSGTPVLVTLLQPNEEIHFPDGDGGLPVSDELGEDHLTILASEQQFKPGIDERRRAGLPGRVVHEFRDKQPRFLIQKTITMKTVKP